MKRKIYGVFVVLIVISILLEGCGVNGAVCKYLRNCYFEYKNSATFSDVNVIVDYSLIPVNAYIKKIGEFSGKQLVNNKAIINLLLLQKNEMNPSNFSQRNLDVLQGDLLFEFSGQNFSKNFPPSLRIYLDKLYKNFVLEYKDGKLSNESDVHTLSYYENLLYLMRETRIFQQDIALLNEFRDDSNFTKDKILSRGIFIVNALNYLILRSRIANSQFYPLPFSTDLIQKRKNQLIKMKNILLSDKYKFTDSYKLFALETFSYFSLAFNGVYIINKADKGKIKEYFEEKTSVDGLFVTNTGISDSIFNTYLVAKISNRLSINNITWHKKVIQTIEKLNKSSTGVFVIYNKIYFNPWDTYRALFLEKEKCKLYFGKLYNIYKLKNTIANYLQYPDKHTFEENYYAEKSALIIGLSFSKKKIWISIFPNYLTFQKVQFRVFIFIFCLQNYQVYLLVPKKK